MTAQREFILGEEKYIDFQVRSSITQTVVITSATYTLSKNGIVNISGVCIINGNKLSVLLEPPELGVYLLEITYIIAEEKRKVRVSLSVV
ncbi:MAG: hypothetical protein ACYCWE_22375 [Eubacteriales bacterium]